MTRLSDLLFGSDQIAQRELEAALAHHDSMKSVLVWPGLTAEIAKGIVEFLHMPIGNLAVSAYQKHQLIETAKRETAKNPGAPQVVQLMKHTIRRKLEPNVDIEVGGVTKTLLRLELATEISIETMTAVVQSGQVIDLTPGEATAKVTFSAGGVELAKAESQPVDLTVPDETKIVIDLSALGEPIIPAQPLAG